MPKYLLKASYNAEGVRGVMKEGGSKREAAARALVKSLGGKVESFYFCHGDADAIVICDFPDLATHCDYVVQIAAGLKRKSGINDVLLAEHWVADKRFNQLGELNYGGTEVVRRGDRLRSRILFRTRQREVFFKTFGARSDFRGDFRDQVRVDGALARQGGV